MAINPERLHYELFVAGLPILGVWSDEHIEYTRELTENEIQLAQTVISAHNSSKLTYDQLTKTSTTQFKNLPNWATWTPQQGKDAVTGAVFSGQTSDQIGAWIDTNVTTLANAKTALKMMATAIVSLRDVVGIMAQAILFLRDIALR